MLPPAEHVDLPQVCQKLDLASMRTHLDLFARPELVLGLYEFRSLRQVKPDYFGYGTGSFCLHGWKNAPETRVVVNSSTSNLKTH